MASKIPTEVFREIIDFSKTPTLNALVYLKYGDIHHLQYHIYVANGVMECIKYKGTGEGQAKNTPFPIRCKQQLKSLTHGNDGLDFYTDEDDDVHIFYYSGQREIVLSLNSSSCREIEKKLFYHEINLDNFQVYNTDQYMEIQDNIYNKIWDILSPEMKQSH